MVSKPLLKHSTVVCPRGIGFGSSLKAAVGMAVFVPLPSASVTVTEVLHKAPETNPLISNTILKGLPAIMESTLGSCTEIVDGPEGSTVPVWAFACKNRADNRMNTNKNFVTKNLCVKYPL